ncbi:MAG: hypothetical protein AABX45_02585 [Nanoarchaeota archaeon]
MKEAYMKSYKEIKTIFVIILILTIVFGYNDNKPSFILKDWLLNFIYVFILVSLTILFNTMGYKLTAKYLGAEAEIKIWNSHKFSEKFKLTKVSKYILTPVLSILITLFSNGKIFFSAVSTFDIKNYSLYGRKFPKLSYFNLGLIAVGGLFFNFILMILFKILMLKEGVLINAWFIVWNLLPISELPGAKIFFASRVMYLFSLIFFIVNILLVQNLSILTALIISFFFSILAAVVYFYLVEYLKS